MALALLVKDAMILKKWAMVREAQFTETLYPQIRLSMKSDLHLIRKIWHMGMGLVAAAVYQGGLDKNMAVVLLGAIFVFDLSVELGRLRYPKFNQKVIRIWRPLMRGSEVRRMSGVPYYLAACTIAVGLFPKPVAVLSILFLAIGDPIASLVGIRFGSLGPRFQSGKSLIGTLAAVLCCSGVAYLFTGTLPLSFSQRLAISAIGGIAGGTAELLPLQVDDNLSIPLVSGLVLWLCFIWAGLA